VANIAYDIRKGFYDLLLASGNTALRAKLAQVIDSGTDYKLYYIIAPQYLSNGKTPCVPPYVVMAMLPITPDMDTATKMYRVWVQFLVSATTVTECESISGMLTDILEDSEARLTIGSYHVVEIRRQPEIVLPSEENVANMIIQYSLLIHG
jgi:hypothetical protein